jgi:hypothetical protein
VPLRTKPEVPKKSFSEEEVASVMEIPDTVKNYTLPPKFTMEVPYDAWAKVWDVKTNKPKGNYPQLIHDAFGKLNIPCSYNSNGFDRLSDGSKVGVLSLRGYCRSTKRNLNKEGEPVKVCCAEFTIHVQRAIAHNPVKLNVVTSGEFIMIQEVDTSRQIRKETRKAVGTALEFMKPGKMYLDELGNVPNFRFFHCNFPSQSRQVYQKIKSEFGLKDLDRSGDMLSSLRKLQQDLAATHKYQDHVHPSWSGFIKALSITPHYVFLYGPEQIRYGKLCDTIYLDSTGSVVQRTDDRQVLLHSGVGKSSRVPHAPAVPLFEMLSNVGTSASVEHLIRTYRLEVCKLDSSWQPKLVVFDFCLAYAHSCSVGFCSKPLEDYINMKYKHMVNTSKGAKYEGTNLFVCSGHFLHFCSSYMRKKTVNVPAIKVALHAFGSFIECRNLEQYQHLTERVITLFGAEKLDEKTRIGIVQELTVGDCQAEHKVAMEVLNLTIKSDIVMSDIVPEEDSKLKRDQSKFNVYFEKRVDEVLSALTNIPNDESNPFFDPKILETFHRWNTYLPLWSKITFCGRSAPKETITTGYVEQYFGVTKHAHHAKLNEPEDKFILTHAPYVEAKVREAVRLGREVKALRKPYTKKKSIQRFVDYIRGFKPLSASKIKTIPSLHRTEAWSTTQWSTGIRRKQPLYTKNIKRLFSPFRRSADIDSQKRKKTPNKNVTHQPIQKPQPTPLTELYSSDAGKLATKSKLDFVLKGKPWVHEFEELTDIFDPGPLGGYGLESEIMTLGREREVSSFVAGTVAYNLVVTHRGDYRRQRSFRILDTALVSYNTNSKQFVKTTAALPNKETFDYNDSTLFMISMHRNHAWLTRVDVKNRQIFYYDSLESQIISRNEREKYYDSLKAALNEKYEDGMPSWKPLVQKAAPDQLINDCVVISLLCLSALLKNQEPVLEVDPSYAPAYRNQIILELLSETERGSRLLQNTKGNIPHLLEILTARELFRRQISNIYRDKSEIQQKLNKKDDKNREVVETYNPEEDMKNLQERISRFDTEYTEWGHRYSSSALGFRTENVTNYLQKLTLLFSKFRLGNQK